MAESTKSAFFIVGPTGVGKNQLALDSATARSGSLVNVDSVQIYKGLHIGANSPTQSEKELVPHHLFNFMDPNQRITVGQFVREVETLLKKPDLHWPLYFVGGSGFYFQALEMGMPKLKPIPEDLVNQVRELESRLSSQEIWKKVAELSPATAERIHPNDRYRTGRALLLLLSQEATPLELEKNLGPETSPLAGVKLLKVGLYLEKEELRARLKRRLDHMLELGLLDEVGFLLKKHSADTPALQTIGYKECVQYLQGNCTRQQMQEDILKNTMTLAKKQLTWFRKEQDVKWFHALNQRKAAEEFLLSS